MIEGQPPHSNLLYILYITQDYYSDYYYINELRINALSTQLTFCGLSCSYQTGLNPCNA